MKKMRPADCSADEYSSDDEISVGCPSPQHTGDSRVLDDEEMEDKETLVLTSQHISIRTDAIDNSTSDAAAKNNNTSAAGGVRSFSILDILNHRPAAHQQPQQQQQQQQQQRSVKSEPESSAVCSAAKIRRKNSNVLDTGSSIGVSDHIHPSGQQPNDGDSPTKIMRPWDYPHLTLPAHFQAAAAAAAAAGFLNPNRCLPFATHPASSPFLPAPGHHPFGLQSHPGSAALGFHPHQHPNFHHHLHHHHHQRNAAGSSFVGGILSVGGSSSGHLSPSSSSASPDYISAGGSSDCEADDVCSTSGNSATSGGSPLLQQRQKTLLNSGSLVVNNNGSAGSVRKSSGVKKSNSSESGGKPSASGGNSSAGGTPLDALFQMTSKTFDGSSNNGADSSGECGARISNF
jgi:hypothetical protein